MTDRPSYRYYSYYRTTKAKKKFNLQNKTKREANMNQLSELYGVLKELAAPHNLSPKTLYSVVEESLRAAYCSYTTNNSKPLSPSRAAAIFSRSLN